MCAALFVIVGLGIGCGFVTGVLIGFSPLTVLALCFGFWIISMLKPLFAPIYKYVMPVGLSLVGTLTYGIVGFGAGYIVAAILQLIADHRRFSTLEEATGLLRPRIRSAEAVLLRKMESWAFGLTPVEIIISRSALGLVIIGMIYSIVLHTLLGVAWCNVGAGRFSEMVTRGSTIDILLGLGEMGAALGFLRQVSESIMAFLTSSGRWSPYR
jgi:hypothetical protein